MAFELLCAVVITLSVATLVTFYGYRMLFLLLPLWGFFWGFGIGSQSMQALFGQGFLATTTSWFVGFVVAVLFALLSYLFFYIGVAILAGTIGYGIAVAIMLAIGMSLNWLVWLIGLIAGVVLAFVTLRYNLIKHVIIIGTALLGAGVAIGTLMIGIVPAAITNALQNPVQLVLQGGWFMILFFALLAAAGMVVQYKQNASFTFEAWENRI